MVVKTSKVIGRRYLRYESLDAFLTDAEYIAGVETKQLGNWTLGQILMHLATVYEKSIDSTNFKQGWTSLSRGMLTTSLSRWQDPRRARPSTT